METHVYINGREACSKAADGKSTAAFPDPCWAPPTPPAGPVVIPYPNTAHASDLCNGTSSVFICNSMVAQKDQSYFSTSEGDDPATEGLQKGTVSQVIKGKAFFKSWSGNVKFEGLEVPRHQDMMTHNHGSSTNTPPNYYMDDKVKKGVCKDDLKKAEKACAPDPKDKNKKSMLEKILGKDKYKKLEPILKRKDGKTAKEGSNSAWMTHCDGLWVNPGEFKDMPDFKEKLTELSESLQKGLNSELSELIKKNKDIIIDKGLDAAGDMALNKLENAAIRHGAALGGAAIGGVGAVVTEAAAGIWTVGDAIAGVGSAAMTAYESWDLYDQVKDQLNKLPEEMQKILDDATENPDKAMTNMMSLISRLNPCMRAKRCLLVPFNKTNTSTQAPFRGEGCCPGQTGHHVLPGAMFYENSNCPKYAKKDGSTAHKEAPTICAEGSSNNADWGSHGKLHDEFEKKMDKYRNSGWFGGQKDSIDYDDARDLAIETIQKTFPESMCDKKCLKAQLDGYYLKEKICSPNKLNANSGKQGGGQARPYPPAKAPVPKVNAK